MKSLSVAVAALGLLAAAAGPSRASAMPSYFTSMSCTGCHGDNPSCNACHHHGARGLTGALPKASFAPGEAMSVTITSGNQTGWWGAAVLDDANNVLARVAVPSGTSASLAVNAPASAGTYSWKVAWYGNAVSATPPGGATWVPSSNGGHGYQTQALPAFMVAEPPPPTASASLSPAELGLGEVQVGQTASGAASVVNAGAAEVVVTAVTPCAGTTPPFTFSPAAPFAVAPASAAAISVAFAPAAAGAVTGCFDLATSDPMAPTLRLVVSGTGATVTPPPPPPTGSCTSCHAMPPTSGEHGTHRSENVACSSCHGSGYSTTAVVSATHNNGSVNLTSTVGWRASSRSCSNSCHGSETWGGSVTPPPPTGSCTTCHAMPPTTGEHATHRSENVACSSCHGSGYSTTAVVSATHNNGSVNLTSSAGWRASSRSCSNSCHGSESWGGSVTPPPPPAGSCTACHAIPPSTGRHSLHRSESVACGSCHGSGYSSTAVVAATHNNGTANLSSSAGWSATRRSCSNSCHGTESWGGAVVPPPPSGGGCTSCHAIPPSSGEHALHKSERVSCASCHGTGYSTTAVVAATHNNGTVNLSSRTGWRTATMSCSNSCHGTERWGSNEEDGGAEEEDDDFVLTADAEEGGASGCSSVGTPASVLALLGIAAAGLVRRRRGQR